MMLNKKQWDTLANHVRSKLTSLFDPGSMFAEDTTLEKDSGLPHRGFYVGVIDSSGNEIMREGFLKEDCQNVKNSADLVVSNMFSKLQEGNIAVEKIKTSSFKFSIVLDCIYLLDPTSWDENKDGVYFMWGQEYKALYLPYQIQKMAVPKIEIMDRLCCWEAGLASNLWRTPEGLVFRLICDTHTA